MIIQYLIESCDVFTILLDFTVIHILKRGRLRLENINNLSMSPTPFILEPIFEVRTASWNNFMWAHNNHVACLGTILHRVSLTFIMTFVLSPFLRIYASKSEKVNDLPEITCGSGGGRAGIPTKMCLVPRHLLTSNATYSFLQHHQGITQQSSTTWIMEAISYMTKGVVGSHKEGELQNQATGVQIWLPNSVCDLWHPT